MISYAVSYAGSYAVSYAVSYNVNYAVRYAVSYAVSYTVRYTGTYAVRFKKVKRFKKIRERPSRFQKVQAGSRRFPRRFKNKGYLNVLEGSRGLKNA